MNLSKFSSFTKEEAQALEQFFSSALSFNPEYRKSAQELLQYPLFSFLTPNYRISPTQSAIVAKECRNREPFFYNECLKLYEMGDLMKCVQLCDQRIKENGIDILKSFNLYILQTKALLHLEEYELASPLIMKLYSHCQQLIPEKASIVQTLYILYSFQTNQNVQLENLIQQKKREIIEYINNGIINENIYTIIFTLLWYYCIEVFLNRAGTKKLMHMIKIFKINLFLFVKVNSANFQKMTNTIMII